MARNDTPASDPRNPFSWDKVTGRSANFSHGATAHKGTVAEANGMGMTEPGYASSISRITDTYDDNGLPPF